MTDYRDAGRRLRYTVDVARGRRVKRPKTVRCAWCNKTIKVRPRGRLPLYCGRSHQQRAYERRKWQRPHAVDLLHSDLREMAHCENFRRAVWALFQEWELVPASTPAPVLPARRKRAPLYLVKPDDGSTKPDDGTGPTDLGREN